MTNATDTRTTLVLGGTGKTGRRVVERLAARGMPTRVGSRSGGSAIRLGGPGNLDAGAARRAARPTSRTSRTWRSRARRRRSARSPSSRSQSGVRRLVLLSGRGEQEAEQAERAVRESGADVTIVRSTWFTQNFSEDFLAWISSWAARSCCLPATSPSRSSTPTTSPTSRWRR